MKILGTSVVDQWYEVLGTIAGYIGRDIKYCAANPISLDMLGIVGMLYFYSIFIIMCLLFYD